MSKLPNVYVQFKKTRPTVWKAYDELGRAAANAGPLDPKTRELIKLGMAAAMRAESAVQSHTHRALDVGATPEEIEHTLMLGVTTLGFPTMMTALAWAQGAIANHNKD